MSIFTDGVAPPVPPTPPVAAVPEPATWAMMVMGFGVIGYGLRRRPKVTTRVHYA